MTISIMVQMHLFTVDRDNKTTRLEIQRIRSSNLLTNERGTISIFREQAFITTSPFMILTNHTGWRWLFVKNHSEVVRVGLELLVDDTYFLKDVLVICCNVVEEVRSMVCSFRVVCLPSKNLCTFWVGRIESV